MVQSRTKRRYKSKKRKYTRKKQNGGNAISTFRKAKAKFRNAKGKLGEKLTKVKGSFDNYKDLMRLTAYLGTQKGPFGSLSFPEYYPKLWTRLNNNTQKAKKIEYIKRKLSNNNEVKLYLFYIMKFIDDFGLNKIIETTGNDLQLNKSTESTESVAESVAEPVTEPVAEPVTEPNNKDVSVLSSKVDDIEGKLNEITALLQNKASE